jgi:hypothetical protein
MSLSNIIPKHKPPKSPLVLFTPPTARDCQIVEALAIAGFIVAHDFLKKPNGKRRLTGCPRMIVPISREGGRDGR